MLNGSYFADLRLPVRQNVPRLTFDRAPEVQEPALRSKLCNILFTRGLVRRLRGTEVTANCLHPGFVATRFGNESGGLLAVVTRLAKLFAISPATGAETIIYLASSPDVARVTGQYFYRSQPISPSPAAMDDQAALVLWERSAALAGIRA